MNSYLKNKNIVVFASAGIGDFIWATSALSLIKNYDKNIQITLITRDAYIPLIHKNLHIDIIVPIKNKYFESSNTTLRRFYRFYWILKNYFKFHGKETIIFFDIFKYMAIASKYLYGIKNIVGPDLDWFGNNIKNPSAKHYTKVISMPVDSDRVHISIRYQILIRSVLNTCNLVLPVGPDTSYLSKKIKNLMGTTKKNKVAICLKGSVKWRYWDLSYFKEVIEKLHKITDITFFIVGSTNQSEEAEKLKSGTTYADIRNICGQTSLLELHEFFKSTDLLISVDTGCVHIASLAKIPVISLHGTTLPEQSRPINTKTVALCSYRDCSPCNEKIALTGKICNNIQCMHDITPEIVFEEAKKILLKEDTK